MTKSDIGGREYMQIIVTLLTKNVYASFYFSLDFGQRSSMSFGYHSGGGAISKSGISPLAQAK